MAEVALAVMLVIGAGLLAAHGLQPHDRRRRLRSVAPGDVLDDAAAGQLSAAVRSRADLSAAARAASRRAGRAGGHGDVRPAAESSAQRATTRTSTTTRHRRKGRSRTSTTTRTSCPTISRRWAFRSCRAAAFKPADAASSGDGRRGQRDAGEHVLEGTEPDRAAPAAVLRRSGAPWFTVIGVAKDVKQGGVDQQDRHRVLSLRRADVARPPAGRTAPATMNVVLRTTLPPAALAQTIERVGPRGRSHRPDRPAPRHGRRVRRIDPAAAPAGAAARRVCRAWRCCSPPSAPTACSPTWSPSAAARSAFAWRSAPTRSSVLAQVMKQGLLLTAIGIVVGLAGALGLNRLMASLLFGVQPTDATTLVA